MTPYERLMAEAIPTGTFGDTRPHKPHTEPWTTEEQAQHVAELLDALKGWHDPSDEAEADRNRHRPAHLRLVHTTQQNHAA